MRDDFHPPISCAHDTKTKSLDHCSSVHSTAHRFNVVSPTRCNAICRILILIVSLLCLRFHSHFPLQQFNTHYNIPNPILVEIARIPRIFNLQLISVGFQHRCLLSRLLAEPINFASSPLASMFCLILTRVFMLLLCIVAPLQIASPLIAHAAQHMSGVCSPAPKPSPCTHVAPLLSSCGRTNACVLAVQTLASTWTHIMLLCMRRRN